MISLYIIEYDSFSIYIFFFVFDLTQCQLLLLRFSNRGKSCSIHNSTSQNDSSISIRFLFFFFFLFIFCDLSFASIHSFILTLGFGRRVWAFFFERRKFLNWKIFNFPRDIRNRVKDSFLFDGYIVASTKWYVNFLTGKKKKKISFFRTIVKIRKFDCSFYFRVFIKNEIWTGLKLDLRCRR